MTELHSRICVVVGAAGIDVAQPCGALRSRESCNSCVLTGVPSLGAGDFWCLQSFLAGLSASELIGTIQGEVSVPLEAAASSALQVLRLSAPCSA